MASKKLLWKPEVNRLTHAELAYELASRGFETGTVDVMRKSLRNVIKMEADQTLSSVANPVTFATDKEGIIRSLTELDTLLGTFDGEEKSFRRISALLLHTIRRIDRVNAGEPDELKAKRQWCLTAQNLKSDFETKHKKLQRSATLNSSIAAPPHSSSPLRRTNSSCSDSSDLSDNEPVPSTSTSTHYGNYRNPVRNWGVTFDGEPSSSLDAFLERVIELGRARHVSTSQIFDATAELLTGSALLWYRSIRDELCNWEDLVRRLRENFLPSDYDEKLRVEIFNRIQGSTERPTIFAAAMRSLYHRLSDIPTEDVQVRRIVKNLLPQYSQPLALTTVVSYSALTRYLKQMEDTMSDAERFTSKAHSGKVLAPDLSFKPSSSSKRLDVVDTPHSRKSILLNSKPTIRNAQPFTPRRDPTTGPANITIGSSRPNISASCWNCGEVGHLSPSCPRPQKKHCYKCGELNHTSRTCPKCNKSSENSTFSSSCLETSENFSDLDPRSKYTLDFLLASSEGDERPYLSVQIFGKTFLGLLDSGASRTIIGNSGWNILKSFDVMLLPSPIQHCTIANGESCPVLGILCVPITVERRVVLTEILVMPSLPHSLILGVDFWRKLGIIPNIRHGGWTFGDTTNTEISSITDVDHLTFAQTAYLHDLLKDNFTDVQPILGCTDLVEHEIRTTAEPIKQRYYPLSPALQKHVDAELDNMLDLGVVEPSKSPWASPIVMVKKKDGSYRFCVDYRKVNKVTERDAYPLPYISTILDRLRDAKFLSSLDVKSAYWQIPVKAESRPITAFTVPNRGLFQFRRLPFGLHNSPATWQRLIDRVIGADLEPYVFVYLDDIVIVSNDFDKHLEVLREVLTRLKAAGLTVHRDKCSFCRPELRYLGYVVNKHGLLVDPEKVSAILNVPTPTSVTEVRRVLGMASWYRRFIPNFSTVVAPITSLTKKNVKFLWTDDCQVAFSAIKQALVAAPILSCPDFSKEFTIQTDASDYGLGAVLSQTHPDGEHVVSYISCSLQKAARNYSTTEKECLAVLWAIEKFRPYVEGTRFTVISDHHSLIWLNNLKDPSGRLARWSVRLQQYDFSIIHRKGKDHVVPDCLSRSVQKVDAILEPDENVALFTTTDNWYCRLRTNIESKPDKYPGWRVADGKVFKYVSPRIRGLDPEIDNWRFVVPTELRKEIICENHDLPTAGHTGVFKTFERLATRYYWPKMRNSVARYIRNCVTCATHKVEQKRPYGFMAPRAKPSRPWQFLCIDIVGPLPRSAKGYCYILVISDCFTKYSCFFPLRRATAAAVSRVVEDEIFLIYGTPEYIISDNGVQFRSREFGSLCERYRTRILFNAPYHPQANPAERVNRVLKTMLSSYVADNHRKWDTLLAKVGCAIRTSKHEVIGHTPFFANFGREHHLYGDHLGRPPDLTEPLEDPDRSVDEPELKSKGMEQLRRDIKHRLSRAYERASQRYNLRRRPVEFAVNSRVWRRNFALSNAANYINAKLAAKFIGPFTITKRNSPWTYQLADDSGVMAGTWHVQDLKPYLIED